jgi:aconitase B
MMNAPPLIISTVFAAKSRLAITRKIAIQAVRPGCKTCMRNISEVERSSPVPATQTVYLGIKEGGGRYETRSVAALIATSAHSYVRGFRNFLEKIK